MFIIKIHYLVDGAEVDKYVPAHRDFLDVQYQKGLFIASGPLNPRTGGIIIALGRDKAALEAILKDDPYQQAGIASYEFIEFTAVKYCKELATKLNA